MTRSTALAGAARRVRALTERLPEPCRPDITIAWAQLLETIENRTDRQAVRLIAEWVEDQEHRLTGRLLNSPLEDEAA